jgi:hypothetical protein
MSTETWIVLALASMSAIPFLAFTGPERSAAGIVFFGLVLAALGVAAWMSSGNRESKRRIPVPVDRPVEVRDGEYVSSQSCRSCHPGEYDSWRHSFHRTMTQLPTEESVLGDFNNASLDIEGLGFQMERRGKEFWVNMPEFNEQGHVDASGRRMERRIELITGSHHMQVYWFGGGHTSRIDQFPAVWLIEEGRWIPRDSSFLTPPHQELSSEPGSWNKGCITCHATGGNPQLHNDFEMYSQVGEFGIACEACHGPATEHVAVNGNPLRRYSEHFTAGDGDSDGSVTHPERLSHPLDSQVCGQCHSVNAEATSLLKEQWRKRGFSYRPGMDLGDERRIYRLSEEKTTEVDEGGVSEFIRNFFWSDGMVRVTGREYNGLIESPCYVHGAGDRRLSCFSCHEMHGQGSDEHALRQWADDQLKPGMRGNRACLQCHEDYARDLSAHTHHATGSSGSSCYNCHMSHTTYGLLNSIRSHQIGVPDVATDLATGRPNACNQCHLDRTLAWTSGHLLEWYGIEAPPLSEEERNVAASILWLLKGDAGQRALMAWSLGWEPAAGISGEGWRAAYLSHLLMDPYGAVRFMAYRSLRGIPGYDDFDYDFLASPEARAAVARKVRERWRSGSLATGGAAKPEFLLLGPGEMDASRFDALLRQRDDTPMVLSE